MFKDKSALIWLAAGVSVSVTAVLLARTLVSKASAKEVKYTEPPESILLIGDSQTAGHLGAAFEAAFSNIRVDHFGKNGATHEHYLERSNLRDKIRELPCADIIYIQLGDNGVPETHPLLG